MKNFKLYTISFTGNRPNKLPWGYDEKAKYARKIRKRLKNIVIDKIKVGCQHFIVGMALGIDMMAAEIIIELRKRYRITLEAAIPCTNQAELWQTNQQIRYRKILAQCDKITFVTKEEYTSSCMQKRNEYMVDNSDILIAVWDGDLGGTFNTINYAKLQKKMVIVINI